MMKIKIFIITIILFGINSIMYPQTHFRSGVFLHNSVGANIWGPNGSNTSVPQEIAAYNTSKGYIDSNTISMTEDYFPSNPSGNEWWQWHKIFDNEDTYNDIYPYLENNKIIVIKSCYPSSDMSEGVGSPSDTLNYDWKSIYNYKWHWRHMIRIMENHPDNFFVIWTNAPKVVGLTNSGDALRSYQFSTWAKDTLATGLDTTYGVFPPNVYVFDIFNKLTNGDHYLDPAYAVSSTDNHPNSAATELIAPQFVQEIFDAAIAYEGITPVELNLFNGDYEDGVVNLKWVTATETNNFGFEVERRSDYTAYEKIGFVNGNGTTTNRVTYNFTDKNISSNRYYYRLKQIDMDGTFEYSNELQIDINTLNNYQLFQNYPNPFNPGTKISWQSPVNSWQTLKVFDVLGKEIATLVNEYRNAGSYEINFDGSKLSSGVYYYQLRVGNPSAGGGQSFVETKKMFYLK